MNTHQQLLMWITPHAGIPPLGCPSSHTSGLIQALPCLFTLTTILNQIFTYLGFFFLHLHKILIPATELPAGLRIALSAKSCQGAEVMLHMGGRLGPQGDSPEQLWLPPSAS